MLSSAPPVRDIQPGTIPFVLSAYLEPKGIASLFTTHATLPTPHTHTHTHTPRRSLVNNALPDLLEVKWTIPTTPRGEQSREHKATLHLTFMGVFCFCVFCWQELANKRWGFCGQGWGWLFGLPWSGNPSGHVCRHRCHLYLAFFCQPEHVEVSVAMRAC